jgi:hypothetical protein
VFSMKGDGADRLPAAPAHHGEDIGARKRHVLRPPDARRMPRKFVDRRLREPGGPRQSLQELRHVSGCEPGDLGSTTAKATQEKAAADAGVLEPFRNGFGRTRRQIDAPAVAERIGFRTAH